CVSLPDTTYGYLSCVGGDFPPDATRPAAYILKHMLATRYAVIANADTREQLLGAISIVGGWLALLPQIEYTMLPGRDPNKTADLTQWPLVLGFHHLSSHDKGPQLQGGVPNLIAIDFARTQGQLFLIPIRVKLLAAGSYVDRVQRHLELARDIA